MKPQFILTSILLTSLVFSASSACLSSQVYEPVAATCADKCLPSYYIVEGTLNKVCVPQDPVNNIIRETPNPFRFIIIFDQINRMIFSDVSQALQYLSFLWDFGSGPSAILNVDIALNFLDSDNTVLEVVLTHKQSITWPAILNVDFKNNNLNPNSSFYFVNSRLSMTLLHFSEFSARQQNLINVLTQIDSYSEIGWTATTIFNCYPVIYMYGKFYRETFNLYKMTGVSYSPLAQEFLRRIDNKVAGIKVPNVPAIVLYKKPLTSGWDNIESSRLLLQENPTRDDYKIILSPKFQEWNTTPLFLENFGIEITLMLGTIALMVIIEILAFFIFNESTKSLFYTLFNAFRVFLRWNFLLGTIIGSLPTLIYYAAAQIKALAAYGTIGHNLGGSIAAIILLVMFGVVFPIFSFKRIRQTNQLKESESDSIHYSDVLLLKFYGLLHQYYKSDRIIYPLFTFIPIIRAVINSLITFFFPTSPIVQISFMMAMSVSSFSLLARYRPYSKKVFNIMHLGFEFLNLSALILLEIIATNQDQQTFSNNAIEIINLAFIYIWIVLPFWTLFVGLFVIITKLARLYKKEKSLSTFSQRKSVVYSSKVTPLKLAQQNNINVKREKFESQKTVDTIVFDNGSTNRLDMNSPGSSRPLDEEEGHFIAARRRPQNIVKLK